ncbi:hypothetical protein [Ruania zhangjianzhongii]|uniref:hypothetical protein n=1 Tax=Ruania zhangjianzhongii TaxID=2603206 RepID=UPI001F18990A|nr:hypothetical protein [Ruania zhangjianzhongii]
MLSQQITELDAQFAGARFLPADGAAPAELGSVLDAIVSSHAGGVLMLMVGQNGVEGL